MRAILLSISACVLGLALQVRDGLYSPLAIALLAMAIALAIAATFIKRRASSKAIEIVLLLCVLVQLAMLFTDFPGSHHTVYFARDYAAFLSWIAAACVVIGVAIIRPARTLLAFTALLVIYLFAGFWLLHKTPAPYMDVFVFQNEATSALRSGENPYAMTFTDLYAGAGPTVYAPGVRNNGRLNFGFPYMPLVLEWNYLWQLREPDYRYGNLIAVALAAALIADSVRSRAGMLVGALLLFTPRGFFIVEQGWTEPLTVLLLALTIWCAVRHRKVLPVALGLFLASKQYCAVLLPLIPLLISKRESRGAKSRFVLTMIVTACVVTMPFVIVNFSAFSKSAVTLQFRQPFRADALSFPALLHQLRGPELSGIIAIVAALLVAGACAWYFQRTLAAFALGVMLVFFTFFALNKQAFANYYFLVLGAICCAIATSLMPQTDNVR